RRMIPARIAWTSSLPNCSTYLESGRRRPLRSTVVASSSARAALSPSFLRSRFGQRVRTAAPAAARPVHEGLPTSTEIPEHPPSDRIAQLVHGWVWGPVTGLSGEI